MKRPVGVVAVLTVPVLFASGCATESWTESLFAKQEVQIDERFIGVERRANQTSERVSSLGNRVTSLETSMVQTGEMARGARDQADVALARADAVDKRVTGVGVAIPRFTRDPVTRESATRESIKAKALLGVVHVRFGFDRADLDEGAEKALLAVLKELRENPGLTVALEGATDSMGSRDYNVQLSQRRVETVRRFLLAKGVESPRVIHSTAVGPLRDEKIPDEQKRRVAVKLMKAE